MKAVINNDYVVTIGESARLSQVSKTWTFIRVKKGTFADIELARAASAGMFDLDDQGGDWRLTIKTENVKWED